MKQRHDDLLAKHAKEIWNVSINYTWVFVACYKTANVSTMKEKKQ